MKLKSVLQLNGLTQRELAVGIGRTDGYVSMLLNGDAGASKETIDAILSYLSSRLNRSVTYEELFGASSDVPAVAAR